MTSMLQHLALIRFLVSPDGLTPSRLKSALEPLAGEQGSRAEWQERFEVLRTQLVTEGWVTQDSRGRMRLTSQGHGVALGAVGFSQLPSKIRWAQLKRRAAAKGLGLPLEVAADASALRVALVARAQGIEWKGKYSEARLRDALAWKALGVATTRPLSRRAVQGVLIARLTGGAEDLPPEAAVRLLSAQSVGARRSGSEDLWRSALRRCVNGEATSTPASFAQQVLSVAKRTTGAERFGEDKVFISAIWRRWGAAGDPVEFKHQLGVANHLGQLRLSRADLPELMDPAFVAESETRYENATFHFVRL